MAYKPLKNPKIRGRPQLIMYATRYITEKGPLPSKELYNLISPHKSRNYDFSMASMSMRLLNEKQHRFKHENGLWSLRTDEMKMEVENRIKGVI